MFGHARQGRVRPAALLPDLETRSGRPFGRRNGRQLRHPGSSGALLVGPLLLILLTPALRGLRHPVAPAGARQPQSTAAAPQAGGPAIVTRVKAAARIEIRTREPAPTPDGHWVSVWATAYCPNCKVCDTGGRTATGTSAKTAGLAVAARGRRLIRLGSRVYVRNFGWLKVDDTGGGVRSNQIDIRMQSHRSAVRWGRRLMRVCLDPSP